MTVSLSPSLNELNPQISICSCIVRIKQFSFCKLHVQHRNDETCNEIEQASLNSSGKHKSSSKQSLFFISMIKKNFNYSLLVQLFSSFGDGRACERKIETVVEEILNKTHQQTLFCFGRNKKHKRKKIKGMQYKRVESL